MKTYLGVVALLVVMPACATTGTPPSAAEPSAIEVAPGVFIPGREGYLVLLKNDGTDLLGLMDVPRHTPSPENLDELRLSLFNASCYATPEGSRPWDDLCGHSMLSCTGGAPLKCTDEEYVRCVDENKRVSTERVVLLNHWEPVPLRDSGCLLSCACEGGAITLDKQEPGGYRATGTGCINAFTCSFVCPGGQS